MRSLSVALFLLVAVAPVAGQEKSPFTIDTMWAVHRVGAPVVSPDGKAVAFTVTRYDMEENRGNADIYVVPTTGGTTRRLTTNAAMARGWPSCRGVTTTRRRRSM
jgi:dipeptidyl aminopeptidase/acylaminoacyl peptidase